jgi:hypothetical protein
MPALAALDVKTDLRGVVLGGAVNEDLMQKIWDISRIPLPMSDMAPQGSVKSDMYEWTRDRLAAPVGNATVENAQFIAAGAPGAGEIGDTATPILQRFRNFIQISTKPISISELSNAVSSVGGSGGLAYNLMQAQQELRRDIEFWITGAFASRPGNATTTAPHTASYYAGTQNQTNPTRTLVDAGAGATVNGWDPATGNFEGHLPGTVRALSETMLRNMAQALYLGGCGGPLQELVLMVEPVVKRLISAYMYGGTARIASPIKDVRTEPMARIQGAVEIFITDFGTLHIVPNRFMRDNVDGFPNGPRAQLFMYDPDYFELVWLKGVNTTEAAKLGLTERRIVNAYWGTRFHPECMGVIMDINPTAAMVA